MIQTSVKFYFILVILITLIASTIILTKFNARENDSRLYTKFTTQLAHEKKLTEIVALEWQGLSEYTDPHNPYVRDHFIGQFIFPVILSKIGFPSEYALYFLNTIYRLIFIFIFYLITKEFLESRNASIILWALQLTPINLSYQLRANHEQLLTLSMALTLLGLINMNKHILYKILMVLGFVFSFLVKGLAAVVLFPILGFVWYLLYFRNNPDKLKNLIWPLVTCATLIASLLIYEFWFRHITSYPFLEAYYQIQIYGRSLQGNLSSNTFLFQKLSNLFYYLGRMLVNSLPWTLLLLISYLLNCYKNKNYKIRLTPNKLILYSILASFPIFYLLLFSLSDRLAQRYIFPAYYFFNVFILIVLIDLSSTIRKIQDFFASKIHPCYILIFTWFFLTLSAIGVYFLKGGHNHWLK